MDGEEELFEDISSTAPAVEYTKVRVNLFLTSELEAFLRDSTLLRDIQNAYWILNAKYESLLKEECWILFRIALRVRLEMFMILCINLMCIWSYRNRQSVVLSMLWQNIE